MTDYMLVPVELLRGWHKRINTIAVETAFDVADEMETMLSAAPDVQGEPVGVIRESDVMGIAPYADIWAWLEPGTKLYTAPQPAPAVQGEPVGWQPADELRFEYRHPKTGEAYTVSLSREEVVECMDQELFEKLTACFCECEPIGETYVVDCCCDEHADQFELVAAPQPAEQQSAPDVTGLVTLLEHARCNTCDGSGAVYDGHGQALQCQWCHDRSIAIAAHRKGGEA